MQLREYIELVCEEIRAGTDGNIKHGRTNRERAHVQIEAKVSDSMTVGQGQLVTLDMVLEV